MTKNRNYAREYKLFQSSTKAKKERALRNKNRRKFEREGRVHKGDGKEIDHIRGIEAGNGKSNLRVVSMKTNRSKKEKSRLKGYNRKK